MKSLHLLRWSGSVLLPRTRPRISLSQCQYQLRLVPTVYHTRLQSTSSATQRVELTDRVDEYKLRSYPSPPPQNATSSARLHALHARLSLSPKLPIETLGRCLVDASADSNPDFNNSSLAILGSDLLGYYTSEAILCRYPRLPTEVVFSAMWAYCGPKTLAAITREWGVEVAAAPGGEVDSGLLQFARQVAGNAGVKGTGVQVKELATQAGISTNRPNPEQKGWRRGVSSRTVYDDYFGDEITTSPSTTTPADSQTSTSLLDPESSASSSLSSITDTPKGTTLEAASTTFVRALFGALYLHLGLPLTKTFYSAHILSRHLDYSSLFSFRQPTRDLARLCARENFLPPVARIMAETGRQSRHPVFVVGVFSGREKLGEGSGGSLDEARIKAAVSALKGWYLYSPLEVKMPSQARRGEEFAGVMIDGGEVVV